MNGMEEWLASLGFPIVSLVPYVAEFDDDGVIAFDLPHDRTLWDAERIAEEYPQFGYPTDVFVGRIVDGRIIRLEQ